MNKSLLLGAALLVYASSAFALDMYMVGADVNGSSWAMAQADAKMTETTAGVYEWTGKTLGNEFKINDGTWEPSYNIGMGDDGSIKLDTPYHYFMGDGSGNITFDGFQLVNNPKVVLDMNAGTILLSGEIGEEEPAYPSDITFYMIGSNVNGQSWALAQEDAKFTDEGNGIYRWKGEVLGTGFKINDGTWNNGDLNIGSAGSEIAMNTPYYYWADGSSSNIAFEGFTTLKNPEVVLNLNETTITLVGGTPDGVANWYVCGLNGVYELSGDWMLSQVGETNVYEREVYIVETAGKIKISDDGWAHQYGTNLPEENFIDSNNLVVYVEAVHGEGGDIPYELEEGSYKVTFDLDALTLTFVPSGPADPEKNPQFDKNSESGIYLGLMSFNKNVNKLPFRLLTQTSVSDFYYFIQNMQMDNATLLYYAVDLGLSEISSYRKYPIDLSNILLITFTDGLDRGSLAYRPDFLTDNNYVSYLADRISKTKVGNIQLQAYAIGLTGMEDQDEDKFMYNLQSLSYPTTNAHSVDDLEDVKNELINIYNEMSQQTVSRSLSITIPVMSNGDVCRFTLDGTRNKANVDDSRIWIQGEFDIRNLALKNVQYKGMSSVSGSTIYGEQNGIYITFTFSDCRDMVNNILDIQPENIDQWFYQGDNSWLHNTENINSNVIIINDFKNSAAVMLLVDSSTSLGDSFQNLKETALSFIDKLLDKEPEDTDSVSEVLEDFDWSEAKTYNLQGIQVVNPQPGIYIQCKDGKTRKILIH